MRIKDELKTQAIYTATLTLVKERGIAGINMSDVASAASIATGTLYIYFKNKEELVKALFERCLQQSAEHYFTETQGLLVEEKLQKIFSNIIHYKIAFFESSVFLEQSYHSPYMCSLELEKGLQALKPLFALVRKGIRENYIKDHDPELIVSFMYGIIHEMVKKAYFTQKKLSPSTIAKIYSMFWDGIRKR